MKTKTIQITQEEFDKICKFEPIKAVKIIKMEKGFNFDTFIADEKNPPRIYMTGDTGMGKTGQLLRTGENFYYNTHKPVYVMGFPQWRLLPQYFIPVDSVWDIELPGLLLVDEAGLTNVPDINELFAISRHKGVAVLYAGQTFKQIKPTTLNLIQGCVMKAPSYMQLKIERKEMLETLQKLDLKLLNKNNKQNFYFENKDNELYLSNTLPSFWTDEISKSFANFTPEEYNNLRGHTEKSAREWYSNH